LSCGKLSDSSSDESESDDNRFVLARISAILACFITGLLVTALNGIYLSRRYAPQVTSSEIGSSCKKLPSQNSPSDFGLPSHIPLLISVLVVVCGGLPSSSSAGSIVTLGLGLSLANRGLGFSHKFNTTATNRRGSVGMFLVAFPFHGGNVFRIGKYQGLHFTCGIGVWRYYEFSF